MTKKNYVSLLLLVGLLAYSEAISAADEVLNLAYAERGVRGRAENRSNNRAEIYNNNVEQQGTQNQAIATPAALKESDTPTGLPPQYQTPPTALNVQPNNPRVNVPASNQIVSGVNIPGNNPVGDGNYIVDNNKIESKDEAKNDKIYEKEIKEESELVDDLSNINYSINNPPSKLYERKETSNNKHLPPVYFKSYYLSLAFKAVKRDNKNDLRAVLARYGFLNGQNKDGDTILMYAIQNNSLNSGRLLLAKGAYVNAVNHRNRTALHYASTLGNVEFVKLLLTMGADYTVTDDIGMTAIDYADAAGQYEVSDMITEYIEQNNIQQR